MSGASLIDTDVFSFIFKGDTRAQVYEPHLRNVTPLLAFMTVAELRLWAIERRWDTGRRQSLEAAIARTLMLPTDDLTTRLWAETTAMRRARGGPIACGDCWIAALALRHSVPPLTHNAEDYAHIPGLRVISSGTSLDKP